MDTRGTAYAIATCVAALLTAGQAAAQFGVGENQEDLWSRPKGNVENVQVKGKVRAMQGDVLQVADEEAKPQWLVKMPREPAGIHVYGTARPTFLQPGMLVRFSGLFDSKGNPKAPIEKLEVFTPAPVKEGMPFTEQFGVFPEAAFGGQLAQDAPATGQPKSDVASYVVSGQLRGFRKGEILVAAGSTPVRAALSEKVQISVDVPDIRWVRPGDEIEVHGWSYPHLKTHVVATRVTVRTKEPLGVVPQEKPGKMPAQTPAGKSGKPGAKTGDGKLPF